MWLKDTSDYVDGYSDTSKPRQKTHTRPFRPKRRRKRGVFLKLAKPPKPLKLARSPKIAKPRDRSHDKRRGSRHGITRNLSALTNGPGGIDWSMPYNPFTEKRWPRDYEGLKGKALGEYADQILAREELATTSEP